MINSGYLKKHPGDVQAIMAQCIIIRAEHLFWSGEIEYQAYSMQFDPVPEGERMPVYIWEITDEGIDARFVGGNPWIK